MWGCFSNFMICTSLKIFFRFSSSSWVLSTIFIATWRQRDKKRMEGEMRMNDERLWSEEGKERWWDETGIGGGSTEDRHTNKKQREDKWVDKTKNSSCNVFTSSWVFKTHTIHSHEMLFTWHLNYRQQFQGMAPVLLQYCHDDTAKSKVPRK